MKLTMDALKERADAVASEELLLTISGGTENACHDGESSGCSHLNGEGLFYTIYHLWFEC